MKRNQHTEEQIAFALKQWELGTPVAAVYRKLGISVAGLYNWRKKYCGLGPLSLNGCASWRRRTGSGRRWWPT
ncbi:transposase [Ectothiorhodospiraceae bacterium WFHF3C12]|nr:transposase [Ectothiorhodospiraceae bacterium WFHF3C12]